MENTSLFIQNELDELDSRVYQEYKKPIFENRLIQNMKELRTTAAIYDFSTKYTYRPDAVAYKYLKLLSATWLILQVNKVSTIFQFTNEKLQNRLLIPDKRLIESILEEPL